MQEPKRVKITTRAQFEAMVTFMAQNPSIAKGLKYTEYGKTACDEKWQELATKLNSLGPPIRKDAGWQKVWNDYKLNVKKKLGHNKKELNSTGGGPFRLAHLNALEEEVSNILCLHKVAQCDAPTYGVDDEVEQQQFGSLMESEPPTERRPEEELFTEIPECQQPSSEPQRNRKRHPQKDDYKKDMLQEQTQAMREIPKLLDKTNKYLKNISNTLEKKFVIYKKMQKKKEAELDQRMEINEFKKRKVELEIAKLESQY